METPALQTADGRWIARRLIIARSFGDRLKGVLKYGALQPDTALLITPCSSIHTFAVSSPIDALFLSSQLRILRLAPQIAPWRIRWAPSGTKHVLELPAGVSKALRLELGTFVCLRTDAGEAEPPRVSARAPCSSAHVQFSLRIPLERRHDCVTRHETCELRARGERR